MLFTNNLYIRLYLLQHWEQYPLYIPGFVACGVIVSELHEHVGPIVIFGLWFFMVFKKVIFSAYHQTLSYHQVSCVEVLLRFMNSTGRRKRRKKDDDILKIADGWKQIIFNQTQLWLYNVYILSDNNNCLCIFHEFTVESIRTLWMVHTFIHVWSLWTVQM